MAVSSLKNKSKLSTLTSPFDIDLGGMIPLSTFTATSNTATVTFSDIPQSYEHLQVRVFAQTNRGTFGVDAYKININSDTGNNYSYHNLRGDGSSANASGSSSQAFISSAGSPLGTTTGSTFGVIIVDVLDYSNTNKNKTVRILGGNDINGTIASVAGQVLLDSGLWINNSAITSITFAPVYGTNFTQYSNFALYGIKRAGA